MVTEIIIFIWIIASLLVSFGPLFIAFHHWDKQDTALQQWALHQGLPEPRRSTQEKTIRWVIAISLFLFFGMIGNTMYEVTDTLRGVVASRAPF
jgi:hypothetical protein